MKKEESFGKIDFVKSSPLLGAMSGILVLLSLVYLGVRGVSWGIDFLGGTEVQVKFESQVKIDELRSLVEKENLINPGIQGFGDDKEYIVRFQLPTKGTEKEINQAVKASVEHLKTSIANTFANQKPEFRRVDSVGPQVGAELKRNGFLSVFYCLLVILIYVGLRFDYKYAPGAVVCLFHDAVITLAIFVLVGKEVNIPILAAILTLMGYSLNDTIVVFDRIRETESHYSTKGIRFIVNKAINDMLQRTLITSGTVLTSASALWLLADGTVADIAFALVIGIIFGTYSSIYVAAPFVMLFDRGSAQTQA
ncbi:MAG: protein translocase subunit SecF [Pseudomonadota bacterium]|jgi:preprotein translocase subunit SecF